jgi:uncharacterized membrane protein YhaH (DUF805 family)
LLTKGRITIKALFFRLLFCGAFYISIFAIYIGYALPKKIAKIRVVDGVDVIYDIQFKTTFQYFENFVLIILPLFLFVFLLIQAVKRVHDVNKSGLFFLIPFYNILLLLSKGTKGSNDYGVDPNPKKKIQYFDELK